MVEDCVFTKSDAKVVFNLTEGDVVPVNGFQNCIKSLCDRAVQVVFKDRKTIFSEVHTGKLADIVQGYVVHNHP